MFNIADRILQKMSHSDRQRILELYQEDPSSQVDQTPIKRVKLSENDQFGAESLSQQQSSSPKISSNEQL